MASSNVRIAPSLLAANLLTLQTEIQQLEKAQADWLHIDVMDGHFVPNLSFGPNFVKAVRAATFLPLDVHLMIERPDTLIPAFAQAGATSLTIHPEAGPHLHRSLMLIKSFGLRAGLALNPATPLELLTEVLPLLDLVLVMSVNPGFGGQSFIPEVLPKIQRLKTLIQQSGQSIDLVVDGGLTVDTVQPVIKAGADVLVVGTGLLGASAVQYPALISQLKGHS